MANRLNKERQDRLEPKRVEYAYNEIMKAGYNPVMVSYNNQPVREIQFKFKGNIITYFPYSGWATGKGIKDGRGLQNLLQQINTEPFKS